MGQSLDGRRHRVASRRQWIQGCGIAGLAGLAGCLGSDDDEEDTSESESSTSDAETSTDETDGSSGVGLEAEDGWADRHDGVEIPDEPGTAVLQIGGETTTLVGLGNAGEDPDGMGTTGAEQFEAQGAFRNEAFGDSGINVEFARRLGYEDTSGTWAESDSITFSRVADNARLGTVIYRLYDDGTLEDGSQAGTLEGRRFVEEPFVHVTRDGLVTIVGELSSHEDDSLDGRFEFGGRLQEGWDGF